MRYSVEFLEVFHHYLPNKMRVNDIVYRSVPDRLLNCPNEFRQAIGVMRTDGRLDYAASDLRTIERHLIAGGFPHAKSSAAYLLAGFEVR